jgi:hypothetical protein
MEQSNTPKRDNVAPLSVTQIEVKNQSDLGVHGKLALIFVNDKLTTTLFYPSDFDRYKMALQRTKGITWHADAGSNSSPAKVWIGRGATNQYVGWEDPQLASQLQEWISKHS